MASALMVHMSDELKEKLGEYASKSNKSMAQVVKEGVAKLIGYDLESEPSKAGRPRKYGTAEERKKANKLAAREKRALVRELLEDHARQEHLRTAQALQDSLDRKVRT